MMWRKNHWRGDKPVAEAKATPQKPHREKMCLFWVYFGFFWVSLFVVVVDFFCFVFYGFWGILRGFMGLFWGFLGVWTQRNVSTLHVM